MRPIKFRAWDKKRKIMRGVQALELFVNPGVRVATGPYENSSGCEMSIDECELMQFTGLLDKNGKEIYEGDLIVDHDPDPAERFEGVFSIEWSDACFWLVDTDGQAKEREVFALGPSSCHKWMEVIGNIYENPDV